MNSQTSTKQTKARPNKNTAESAEHITGNQNIYNDVPAISSQAVSRKSLRLSTDRTSNILGRTGYHI